MKFRKCTFIIFIVPALFGILTALFFAWFDPFGVIHGKEPKLFGFGMRIMAVNAIDSGKFDSYILGTSMLENTSARETEKLFPGSKFANISMSGSYFNERSYALNYLLKRSTPKNVIYSLDYVYLNQVTENPSYAASNFDYLYNSFKIDNLKLYLGFSTINYIHTLWNSREDFQNIYYKNYNMPYNWFRYEDHSKRFGGLDKWFAARNNDQIKGSMAEIVQSAKKANSTPLKDVRLSDKDMKDVENAIKYCNEYVIKFAAAVPQTNFYLFFPPYSRMRFAIWYQSDKKSAIIHQNVVRYFAEMSDVYPNIKVYGFEDQTFPDDIALYKDTGHYHPCINTKINEAIASGTHIITADNVDEYLQKAELMALEFDLKGLAKQIEGYLNSNQ